MGRGYPDDENMGTRCIENLAEEIAILLQGGGPLRILPGDDAAALANALAGTRIRTIGCPMTMTRAVIDAARDQVNKKGLRLRLLCTNWRGRIRRLNRKVPLLSRSISRLRSGNARGPELWDVSRRRSKRR